MNIYFMEKIIMQKLVPIKINMNEIINQNQNG
jgi:hypothetical protein